MKLQSLQPYDAERHGAPALLLELTTMGVRVPAGSACAMPDADEATGPFVVVVVGRGDATDVSCGKERLGVSAI